MRFADASYWSMPKALPSKAFGYAKMPDVDALMFIFAHHGAGDAVVVR